MVTPTLGIMKNAGPSRSGRRVESREKDITIIVRVADD